MINALVERASNAGRNKSREERASIYAFKLWNASLCRFITQPRKATIRRIAELDGRIISGTKQLVDMKTLDELGFYKLHS